MNTILDHSKLPQKYFETLSAIPRNSGNEQKISSFICAKADLLGLEYFRDDLYNVVVKKPATKGYESSPAVMLQAHMDMVCVKDPGSKHDFTKDPIILNVEDHDRLNAVGTSLGADDLYGVSYMLAIMEEDFPHPPLEFVFTTQEENGCWGAKALDCSKLKAKKMIGLDIMGSNLENESVVGCFSSDLIIATKSMDQISAAGESLSFKISGIRPIRNESQHHPEFCNAIKIAARVLESASLQRINFRLSEIKGGEAENYSPVECNVSLTCDNKDAFIAAAQSELNTIMNELDDPEQHLTIEFDDCHCIYTISENDSMAVTDFMYFVPSGTFSSSSGKMTATNNVGKVTLKNGSFELVMSDRVIDKHHKGGLNERFRRLSLIGGLDLKFEIRYESWEYSENSYLRKKTSELMHELWGIDMVESICPGGLECCEFLKEIPELDIVMLAPIGQDCHTTKEWMSIKSFDHIYDFLKKLLISLDS
jgi:dipeptidase D